MIKALTKKMITLAFAASVCLLAVIVNAQEVPYYRYTNDKGVTVISTQIPARYVKKGYEIITVDGRLIERVAPEASAEEKARLLREQEEQERLKKWDRDLLRRYSHPNDIEAAKQRKLAQNSNAIGILNRNLEKIDQEINRYQSLAAADEREGRDVSADTLESIARLKRERAAEEEEIAQREKQREQIIESYDKDIARFKVIRPGISPNN